MTPPTKILFITAEQPDYLSGTLLHGLREMDAVEVVDYPRYEHLYDDAPDATRMRTHGHGFTAFYRQSEPPIDRAHVWARAAAGEFDLIVFGDIDRCFGLWASEGLPLVGKVPVAIVDGSDPQTTYPKTLRFWRHHYWWFLPRAGRADFRFKRELGPWTHRSEAYFMLPAWLGRRIGPSHGTKPIAFSIPADNLVADVPAKTQRFPTHIVDAEVSERLDAQTGYAFESEADYYADLRASRFGITTKKAGWDCMRHYELAASAAIPCFRALSKKPAQCAPHGLVDGVNCIDYGDADDLFAKLDRLSADDERQLAEGALEWARSNTTRARAAEFLAACGLGAERTD